MNKVNQSFGQLKRYTIVAFLLSAFFLIGSIYVTNFYYSRGYDYVVLLIIMLELFFCIMRAVVLFALHIFCHSKITKNINDVLKINKTVIEFAEPIAKFNYKIENIIKTKFFIIFLELFCMMSTISVDNFHYWFILSYPLLLALLVTAVYTFGGMLMNFNNIAIINTKLRFIIKNIRKNERNLVVVALNEEDLTKASILLNRIQKSTTNMNKVYGVHISITLIGSIISLLCSVKFFK